MNTSAPLSKILRDILTHSTRGIAGLVDHLLAASEKYGLQIEWQADRFRFRSFGGDWEELTDVRLRKSVFRAVLARFAVLCNQRTLNAVSPYGGQGEVSIDDNSPALFRISFTNTLAEQKLELKTETRRSANGIERSSGERLVESGRQGPQTVERT